MSDDITFKNPTELVQHMRIYANAVGVLGGLNRLDEALLVASECIERFPPPPSFYVPETTAKDTIPIHLGLMREFEKGRKVAELLGDRHLTDGGGQYIVLTGSGAEDGARAAFAEYAKERNGVLYWRTLPEISGGHFYMRLFIEKD